MSQGSDLRERVDALAWYHTIDLGDGIVTKGFFDNRPCVAKLPFPDSLAGMRCLDVGTCNGFWAFEMERRGAQEVIATDLASTSQLDLPGRLRIELDGAAYRDAEEKRIARGGFELAKARLGSSVEWREAVVYDLSPESLGTFDFVFVGALLLHLRDPVRALEAIRSVCTGELLVFDMIDPVATITRRRPTAIFDGSDRNWWWIPNSLGMRCMIESAGWDVLEITRPILAPTGAGFQRPPLRKSAQQGLLGLLVRRWGAPQIGVRARPMEA